MLYREAAPHPALRGLVRCYWFLEAPRASAQPPAERILPDGSPELIVHLGEPYARLVDGRAAVQDHALVVGQLGGAFHLLPSRQGRIAAVRFEPQGLAAFLSVPAHELRDDSLSAHAAWGAEGERLRERLGEAADARGMARAFDAFLLARFRRDAPDARVQGSVARLRAAAGALRVDDLASEAGTSCRQLERLFLRDVGLSPKRLARVFRLQAALALLRRDRLPLAEVAHAARYADQPHMDRDFRELAGLPPSAFRPEGDASALGDVLLPA